MAQTLEHQDNETGRSVWKRGLFMLLFTIAFAIAETVLLILTLVQFVWMLVTGEPNRFIQDFGTSMSKWLAAVARYQVGATEEKPFPWTEWPSLNGDHQSDLFDDDHRD